MKIIMLRGLPASGKTSWAKEFVKTNPGFKRLNKDDMREMLDAGEWSHKHEAFILKIRDLFIIEALKEKVSVIIDDTNYHTKHEARLRQLATQYKADFEIKDFDTSLEECLKRDLARPKSVGEAVIRDMYKKYVQPNIPKVKQDESLPEAIICDLDGTLAILNDRNPYDASTCEADGINEPVLSVLKWARDKDLDILCMSGREDKYREQTLSWLTKNLIPCDELFMRKTDDNRKDYIIKEELFRDNILEQYNVKFVLDDRNQVVEMWRRLGLTCFQVAEGNF